MTMSRTFIPVIFGGNRGAYGLARAIHEQYGYSSEVVLQEVVGPVMASTIINFHEIPSIRDHFKEALLHIIPVIEQLAGNRPIIVFGSEDWYTEHLIKYREVFSDQWTVPYVNMDTLKSAVDKSRFYAMCESINVPYPKTWTISEPILPKEATGELVVKPAITPTYQNLHFEGKKKVYICSNPKEAQEALTLMHVNGYPDEYIVQEFIPGKDTEQAVVTCYRSPHDKQVKLLAFGRIIAEDHGAESIGNHLVILNENNHEEVYQHVRALVEAFDFYGFSNFDLIYDKKREQFLFFELNPRLGVSNYYVTAGGQNVAYYYIEDYLMKKPVELSATSQPVLFSLLPQPLVKYLLKGDSYQAVVDEFYHQGRVVHPLAYSKDNHFKRNVYIGLSKINFYRKFWKSRQL
ncbi:ATP-grasp domain-containing protein [Atopobacter phocae]|uniref:carboxylate--amine ligase n=1 Tax=Atopobacter phocae TaxID=136492 RepID=UPI000470610C|nr:ATP-grasp domain-containing protein [Atopobacter phocae]